MATIYRALLTAVLVVWGYVVVTGLQAGRSPADLAWHLRVGLVGAILGVAVQSVPFAYFLGTGFWVKAFVRASRADATWEARHRAWMQGRAYPAMSLGPVLTVAAAIAGGLADSGRLPPAVHLFLVAGAAIAVGIAWIAVPDTMRRNAALMDELAETHHVPRPGTPEMEELVQHEESRALPPLFQLSRVLMMFAVYAVLLWLYLRFGTESFREVPMAPFAILFGLLLTLGLGLNALYDPERPRSVAAAWGRALAVGIPCCAAVLWIGTLW